MFKEYSPSFKLILFLIITAFIFLGPLYRQVLGGENSIFRNWVMWSGMGIGLYDLRLYSENERGEKYFINFKSEIKNNYSNAQYRQLRKLRTSIEVLKAVKLVCENHNQKSSISMKLRKATREGWKTVYDRNNNVCQRNKRIYF